MRHRSIFEFLLVVVIAVAASLAVSWFGKSEREPVRNSASEGAYEEVLETGIIRCGYVTYPPGCVKDPNSGKLSGIFVETLEAAAKNMDLKIVWAEEVGWGSMVEGLRARRYSLIGSPVWPNSSRGKYVDFTVPLFYSGIGVYVRSDDSRFESGNLSGIDDPSIRIATIDGEMTDIIAQQQFPNAQRISLPQLSDNAQLLLNVAERKADVTFVEPFIAELFLANNAGTIKNVASERPLRVFPNSMMLRKEDQHLKSMLDVALTELINGGFVDDLLAKYSPSPGSFYPVAYSYRSDVRAPD